MTQDTLTIEQVRSLVDDCAVLARHIEAVTRIFAAPEGASSDGEAAIDVMEGLHKAAVDLSDNLSLVADHFKAIVHSGGGR